MVLLFLIEERVKREVREMLHKDAAKEFEDRKQIGFGIDGDTGDRELDFSQVREAQAEAKSTLDSILEHMSLKENLGNSIIDLLKSVK